MADDIIEAEGANPEPTANAQLIPDRLVQWVADALDLSVDDPAGIWFAKAITTIVLTDGMHHAIRKDEDYADIAKRARSAAQAGQKALVELLSIPISNRTQLGLNGEEIDVLQKSIGLWKRISDTVERPLHPRASPPKEWFRMMVLTFAEIYQDHYGRKPGVSYDAASRSYGGEFIETIERALLIAAEISKTLWGVSIRFPRIGFLARRRPAARKYSGH